MTALAGGMRALGANSGGSRHGGLTDRPGPLIKDFDVNLLDMNTVWSPSADSAGLYEGRDRASGELKWTATPMDRIFGSNAELRAIAETYASADSDGVCRRLRRRMDHGDEGRTLRPDAGVDTSRSG